MLLQDLPEDALLQCMLYFTLSEVILFANTCRYLKKLSAIAPFEMFVIRTDKQGNLDWILSYVGQFPLDHLMLDGDAFSDSGLAFIKTPLKELIINMTRINCNALQFIDCSALEHICFPECTITVQALSCLNKTRVHTLSFVGCHLEEGVMQFLQAFTQLKSLNLSFTDVTDADMTLLSSNLKCLYLIGAQQITDGAIDDISNIPLEYLRVSCSSISLDGEERLRRNMPNCIFRFPARNNVKRNTLVHIER